MSWMKRRGPPSPNTTNPAVPMYNPNQHSNAQPFQQQWQQPYNNDWYNKEQSKTPPVQQYQQPNSNNYWSQPYNQTQNYTFNTPQPSQQYYDYNQQYAQQLYPQQNNSPGLIQQPQQLQQETQQTQQDPWNWDWEDTSNANANPQPQNQNITDSFANDESWNWSVDDSNSAAQSQCQNEPQTHFNSQNEPQTAKEDTLNHLEHNAQLPPVQKLDLLEELPQIQRLKSDNLTPQWSIESQVSQDSSEDVLTSESDNRSNILSQSSTSQSPSRPEDFIPHLEKEQQNNSEYYQENSQSINNIDKTLQELSLSQFENKEIVSPETQTEKESTPPSLSLPSTSDKNPYKKSTTMSHKSAFVGRSAENLGVNLETLPDNSERPDQELPSKTVRKISVQWPENCEIAPINDRNQYLETGQLSDADVPVYQPENVQTSDDNLPPSGLRRLVIGTNQNVDEPPPGLSRMVVGSTEFKKNKQPLAVVFQSSTDVVEPPVGLHRMIPGESSSPESSYVYRTDSNVFQPSTFDDADNYVSETELTQLGVNLVTQRSATIGADTPPVTTNSNSSSVDPLSREGAVGIDNDLKEADLSVISSTADESLVVDTRREEIEGEPQEDVLIRDQTVGQNTTDSNASEKRNRAYQTDSEHEQPKERLRSSSPGGRYEKDRRYYEDRNRQRDRDSPDSRYRGDRKYDKRRPKDRRYEDDTDYYSDKERRREDREEYERRYNSLRRDKDRTGRRDRRDYDERRSDYYYQNRYDPEYYNRSSRPSSRSDSMHDSYRERNHRSERDRDHERPRHREHDRDRERDHRRRPRDPYNPYYQGGYNYDPYNPYYQQYHQQYHQYYENLRRTNPQAYAEWYRKYYQQQGGAMPHAPGYSTEDRASVHSGRSSANEELSKDRYTRQSYYSQQSLPHYYREPQNASTVYTVDSRLLDNTDSSLILEDSAVISQRLTPAKFSTAHVKASIASGHLVNILPHYPLDGQPATVELISMQSILIDDEEYKELLEFPGPLVKGISHKKTIIDFCESKIKKASGNNSIHDVESYILMWELLILLLRQNGVVVGTDIAELLMKNRPIETSRRQSISSSSSTQHIDTLGEPGDHGTRVSPAMQYKEEYITDKFREYLIYGSGKEALEWAMKNGLWGHALFLASKLDKRTYANVMMRFANGLTMNDPLQTLYQLLSGRQPAATTCVADEKWGDWRPHLAMILSNTSQRPDLDRKAITTLGDTLQQRGSLYAAHFCYLMAQIEFGRYNSPGVKLVLLSSSHHKPFSVFATNEAIFMTEIYEYACGLSDAMFTIPEFQTYKYLMATRMVDYGLLEKGLQYLERVAVSIKQDPSRTKPSLVSRICELADRLKYCDPVQDDGDVDNRLDDHSWLSELKLVLNDYNMGLITHQIAPQSFETETQQSLDTQVEQQWTQPQQEYYQQQPLQQTEVQQWSEPDYNNQNYQPDVQQNYQEQYWQQQQLQQDDLQQQPQQSNDYWSQQAQNEEPPPQISMPNQTTKSKSYFDDEDDSSKSQQKPASPIKSKPAPVQPKQASTGWFGGIWSKLALRPKNQMKLPDDKNPTIVWDSEKKRWVNLEEDNGETSQELKPPPSMSEMFGNRPSGPQSLPAQIPSYPNPPLEPQPSPPAPDVSDDAPKSNQPNMFKLQRGRNIKKAYVDVFNPGGKAPGKGPTPAPDMLIPAPPSGNQMNFFVPQQIADPNAPTDFLTPQTNANSEDNTQTGAPMMYNPTQFSN